MDVTGPGLVYILLVIPSLFAFAVTAQGLVKVSKSEPGGVVILGFGLIFFALIAACYVFFIR